jgi:hypothetical protein
MPETKLDAHTFSPDILDLLRLLTKYQVNYLIVGGQAVIFHGYARLTGALHIF